MLRCVGLGGVILMLASVAAAQDEEPDLQAAIRRHRTADVTLTVTDAAGRPLADTPVTVRMTRHQFKFGCQMFGLNPSLDTPEQKLIQQRGLELFNYGTLAFYWRGYEPEKGKTRAEQRMAQAQWMREHGITAKGHPLTWNAKACLPKWLPNDVSDVQQLQLGRITRITREFAGTIDSWDVINEVVQWDRDSFPDSPLKEWGQVLGRLEMIKRCFAAARKGNPDATLLINDFWVTDDAYVRLVERCLDEGVSIDVIGLQSHMFMGYWPRRLTRRVLKELAPLGKPIHFTELSIVSAEPRPNLDWSTRHTDWVSTPEGEARQAEQVVEFYTELFAHPSVEAIIWWTFHDRRAWLGAPAGLLRKDFSPKPAYHALRKLIREDWWTPEQTLTTDKRGRITFRAFLGDHEVQTEQGRTAFAVSMPGFVRKSVSVAKQ